MPMIRYRAANASLPGNPTVQPQPNSKNHHSRGGNCGSCHLVLGLQVGIMLLVIWSFEQSPSLWTNQHHDQRLLKNRFISHRRMVPQQPKHHHAYNQQHEKEKEQTHEHHSPAHLQHKRAQPEPARHMMFILVGALRTLHVTQDSLLENLIAPLCAPPDCVAHIVSSLSSSDNRPDRTGNDPLGAKQTYNQTAETALRLMDRLGRHWPSGSENLVDNSNNRDTRDRYHYPVTPALPIASPQEQHAMDIWEKSISNPVLRQRWIALRHGDPRRASMWFHRAWTWRYARKEILSKRLVGLHMDAFFFVRPDLLWFQAVPPSSYFDKQLEQANNSNAMIWVHDAYFGALPDTFAYMSSIKAANLYFSIEALIQPGVACLGGPNFNQTVVKERLQDKGIAIPDNMWCHQDPPSNYEGWSEQILLRKLRGRVDIRAMPAGNVLVRAPDRIDCQSLSIFLRPLMKHVQHFEIFFHCVLLDRFTHDQAKSREELLANTTLVDYMHPVRFRNPINDACLTVQYGLADRDGILAHDTRPEPCAPPYGNVFQLFARVPVEIEDDSLNNATLVGFRYNRTDGIANILTRVRVDPVLLDVYKEERTSTANTVILSPAR